MVRINNSFYLKFKEFIGICFMPRIWCILLFCVHLKRMLLGDCFINVNQVEIVNCTVHVFYSLINFFSIILSVSGACWTFVLLSYIFILFMLKTHNMFLLFFFKTLIIFKGIYKIRKIYHIYQHIFHISCFSFFKYIQICISHYFSSH